MTASPIPDDASAALAGGARVADDRYQRLFDAVPDAVLVTDAALRCLDANPAACELLGYARDEIAGLHAHELVAHPTERIEAAYARLMREGAWRGELELRRRDGSKLMVEGRSAAAPLAGGTIYVSVLRDLSARRRVEELAARAIRLQALTTALSEALTPEQVAEVIVSQGLESLGAHAGAVLLTDDGEHLRLLRAFGYPAVVTDGWRHFPLDRPRPLAEAARTGEPVWLEQIAHYAGRYPDLPAAAAAAGTGALAAVPLWSEGRVIGALNLSFARPRAFDDEDRGFVLALARQCAQALERARLYAAERAARAEAEAANRAKDEFLSTLSHELRTPLTAMLGWARLLRMRRLDDATAAQGLETIERSARGQARLVEDLLDVSRIVTGRLMLRSEPVNLAATVAAAIAARRPFAREQGVTLASALDPEAGTVQGDAARLQQVVDNLLSNAIKFTPESGRVDVRLERGDGGACLTVHDTGVGIDPGFLPYVFDRFRQADASSTRLHGGLGLGLAIVRHVVERHGGSVQAESDGPGTGATFTVRLPVEGRTPRPPP